MERKVKLETYEAPRVCGNCGFEMVLEIPKGTRVDTFVRQTDCPKCGCKLKAESSGTWYSGGTGSTYSFDNTL